MNRISTNPLFKGKKSKNDFTSVKSQICIPPFVFFSIFIAFSFKKKSKTTKIEKIDFHKIEKLNIFNNIYTKI